MSARLYLVTLEGPPSKWKAGPETMGVWAVADSPEAATARVWEKVTITDRDAWRVTDVRDHGEPRRPDVVDHVVDEPTPGVKMERLVAYPWGERPRDLPVTASLRRDGTADLSWTGGGRYTDAEARDLCTAILAVADAALERGWRS